jgi:hypothetical protein
MKTKLAISFIFASVLANASGIISDPIADFKINLTISSGDKVLKLDIDVNGDGNKEAFLCLKSDFDKEKEDRQPQSWDVYLGKNVGGNSYLKSGGVEIEPNSIDGILPDIDVVRCFVGLIDELGKNGVVTIRYDNPREGPSIAIIYAYTIEGDHLKKTELTRYSDPTAPNALFTKYLADNKRTVVIPVEIDP